MQSSAQRALQLHLLIQNVLQTCTYESFLLVLLNACTVTSCQCITIVLSVLVVQAFQIATILAKDVMTATHCADSSAVQPACQLSIVLSKASSRMQTSSGSAERPADNAEDSSAAQPAPMASQPSGTADNEDIDPGDIAWTLERSPQDPVDNGQCDRDVDLYVVLYGQWAFFRTNQRSRSGEAQPIIPPLRVPFGRCSDNFRRLASHQLAAFKKINAASSAAQPASQSTAALFPSVLCNESLLVIVRYVGAHNWEIIWWCSKCNPYWYNWYCDKCGQRNKILPWSKRTHFGCAEGANCGCCRSAERQDLPCNACDDLRSLKVTCHTMRDLLKTYSGT